jgi:hypothetical protein
MARKNMQLRRPSWKHSSSVRAGGAASQVGISRVSASGKIPEAREMESSPSESALVQRVEVEAGAVFDEPLLGLQMLRRKECSLGPDDRLELPHGR